MRLYTVHLDSPQHSTLIRRTVEPGEVLELDPADVEREVDAGVADEFEGLSGSVLELLADEGIDPAVALDLGADGLTEIEGIGDVTADKILAAAGGTQTRTVPWLSESTPDEVEAWCATLRERAKAGASDEQSKAHGGEPGLLARAARLESMSSRGADAAE